MKEEADPSQDAAGGSDGIRDIMRILKIMSADMVRLVVVMALLLVSSWLIIGAALAMALASLQAFSLTGALCNETLGPTS